jgi:HipA-like kinase
MGSVDWMQLLADAVGPATVRAHTFIKDWPTASHPVLLRCDDNMDYVVKGRRAGRMVVNDQVIGRLGKGVNAPVGSPALVEVPQELIDAEPQMAHLVAGVAHATAFLKDCSERLAYEHATELVNRPRFASLALLFGWVQAGDHQFIYENASPHLVHSVDHGHFFPNGPDWTIASLAGAPAPAPDAGVVSSAGLHDADLDAAGASFLGVSNEQIAAAVAAPPDDWGLADNERVELAGYLARRRDILFS